MITALGSAFGWWLVIVALCWRFILRRPPALGDEGTRVKLLMTRVITSDQYCEWMQRRAAQDAHDHFEVPGS